VDLILKFQGEVVGGSQDSRGREPFPRTVMLNRSLQSWVGAQGGGMRDLARMTSCGCWTVSPGVAV